MEDFSVYGRKLETILPHNTLKTRVNQVEISREIHPAPSRFRNEIPKYIVIPEERQLQFDNKMTSPMFEHHFINENWEVLYFDSLRNAYLKNKANINLNNLTDKLVVRDGYGEYKVKQIEIF